MRFVGLFRHGCDSISVVGALVPSAVLLQFDGITVPAGVDFWDRDAGHEMFFLQSPNLRLRETESTQLSDFGSPLRLIILRFRLWEKRQIFAVTFFLQFRHRNETQRG